MKKVSTVDEYIGAFPKDMQKALMEIRTVIKNAIPKAEECISYSIPAYKLDGQMVIYFAGFKNHTSIYPAPRSAETFKKKLQKYKGGKGTVQFPLSEPIPLTLITQIVKFRLKLAREKAKAKRS